MNAFNIHHNYATITDSELDVLVENISSIYPMYGEKMLIGRLRGRGVIVQRQRVRASLHRVDPVGVEHRARRVLHHRMYSVTSPNALWHLDGYHKLIRWKIVIHGGIDGYSRLITYLRAASNKKSMSVLFAFQSAIVKIWSSFED